MLVRSVIALFFHLNPSIKFGILSKGYSFINNRRIPTCDNAHSADDAYSYCRRAMNSEDFFIMKTYLRIAMSSFEDCQNYSIDCLCQKAFINAEDGYAFAKRDAIQTTMKIFIVMFVKRKTVLTMQC